MLVIYFGATNSKKLYNCKMNLMNNNQIKFIIGKVNLALIVNKHSNINSY